MSLLSLDDVASLLMQLEATDTTELASLRDALTTLAFENHVPIGAQPFVARAARVLGTLVAQTAPDPDAALAEVGTALEEAMRAMDADPHFVPPQAASTPVLSATPAAADTAMDQLTEEADRDLLPDFILESGECVVHAETALLLLERQPSDEEAINTVFRAFHTVKGTSAFLGLTRIAAFAHEAESLLSRVRDREIQYTPACADLSLRSADMLRELLAGVEHALATDGRLPLPDGYHELIAALAGYDPTREDAPLAAPNVAPNVAPAPASVQAPVPASEPLPASVASTASNVSTAPAPPAAVAKSEGDPTIRVRTDRLDRLIDLVGELVIAQSMIAADEHIIGERRHDLQRKVTHAGKIIRDLQELSMSMRMVPLRGVFQKLARVVRDTASKAGKTVTFTTEGDDVEIDRTLVDRLGDPLVHMVRNAVDHGIEPSNERGSIGKPLSGQVRLRAYHASGTVVVELIDDGRGLRRERIVAKAIEKGLIESDKGMNDSEVFNLIFAPGFSTAEQVTDISGRGVGMDVVRRNLEAIHGRIDITSVAGEGTTFAIRLPLTLAVTDGMLVRVGEERFIIPLNQIHMSFRPEPAMLSTVSGKGEMVLLRGELLRVLRLHRIFDVPDAVESPLHGLLMIVGDGTRRTALLVDELLGQQQVVAKSLGAGVGRVPGISGGAILGDGRVGLILDVNETVVLPPVAVS